MKKKLLFLVVLIACTLSFVQAGNNAQFIRQRVPLEVFAGEQFTVSITFKNNGTVTWTPSGNKSHWLGSENPRDNFIWGTNRGGKVNRNVAPGQNYTFNFTVTAPSTPRNYNFQWQMLQNGVQWFGQKSANIVIKVKPESKVNNSRFINQSVKTEVFAGEQFNVSLTFKNNGTVTWTPLGNKSHWLGSENPRDNFIWGTNRGGKVSRNIAPGQQYTFSYTLTAPSTVGTYNFQWMMLQNLVGWFGGKTPNKRIVVKKCTLPSNIAGKIMFGYQGWFSTAADGAGIGYHHYFHASNPFKPTVDYWPDVSEYGASELYDAGLNLPSGAPAKIYSNNNQATVVRHMKWLKDYNLDGVFLQRFTEELDGDKLQTFRNNVMNHVKTGCETHGRYFGIMYDISTSKTENQLEVIKADWNNIKSIATSNKYITFKGKPLLAIWGIGYDRKNYNYTPGKVLNFIQHMKDIHDVAILIGVPGCWKKDSDCEDGYPYNQYESVYKAADIVMPWRVGGFKDSLTDVFSVYEADVNKINTFANTEFMPVIFPGFSWKNVKTYVPNDPPQPADGVYNWIERDGGNFYWKLSFNAISAGSKMVYVAMFDEIDEGTAMYKLATSASQVPIKSEFPDKNQIVYLNYDNQYNLPSDWYLRCAQKTAQVLRGEIGNTPQLPLTIPRKAAKAGSVAPTAVEMSIGVYPNPADASVEIDLLGFKGAAEVTIYDVSGVKKLNRKFTGESALKLDISALAEGIYILSVKTDGETYTKKLFVH